MNPSINLNFDLITENCFVFNNKSNLRSTNRVCNKATPIDQEIQTIKSFFGETPFTWVVDANDIESIKKLEQNNLQYKASYPAMSLNLSDLQAAEYPKEITIKTVDANDKHLWIGIISKSFNYPEHELSKVANLFSKQISSENLKMYLGYYNNQAAAACLVIKHEDIVTMHWVSTLPEMRNKGLGFAITIKALRDAKESGAREAILLSSVLGKPIYNRLGFQEYNLYKIYGN